MEGKKRLSSFCTKYAIVGFIVLPFAGLLISFIFTLLYSNSTDWSRIGNNLIPIICIAFFLLLAGLFMLSIFNEVYYDKEYIYLKKIFQKQFVKFPLEQVEYIDHSPFMGPDILFINGEKYFFAVSLWLFFRRDILKYIKK